MKEDYKPSWAPADDPAQSPLTDEISDGLAAMNIPIPQPIEVDPELLADDGVELTGDGRGTALPEIPVQNEHGKIIGTATMPGASPGSTVTIDQATWDKAFPPYSEPIGHIAPTVSTGNPKDLIGATKADLSLNPMAGQLHMAAAFADGAAKYGPYNWRENAVKMRVYIAAAQRHIGQLLDREDYDPLSNVHHAGHAMACLAIILDAIETGNIIDDRPLPGKAGELIRRFTPEKKFNN